MPIRIPKDLPAASILARENAFVMAKEIAEKQDIREQKIVILNLMPTKIETETQLLRLLSNSPLQIEVELLMLSTHTPKNTPEDHLLKFYQTFESIQYRKFDGMIITGAPVEHLAFEKVAYWQELRMIMDWAHTRVTSTLYICWAAQAALYHHYGIPKCACPNQQKLTGIFKHHTVNQFSELMRGFDDEFYVPQSRFTEIRKADIILHPDLEILSESDESGVYIVATKDLKQVFITGHPEYSEFTLKNEYERDMEKNGSGEMPKNYYQNNDPRKTGKANWRSHAHLLFSNWLNYAVYQKTDYDLGKETHYQEPLSIAIVLYGVGTVGSAFIELLAKNREKILQEENVNLHIFALANSKRIFFTKGDIKDDWKEQLSSSDQVNNLQTLFTRLLARQIKNPIFIDATTSDSLIFSYRDIIKSGFHLVAANKKANADRYQLYRTIRQTLSEESKFFLYETNVGAGLPLVDTIKYLSKSGDSVKRIIGVFSGSLSFIFNTFSSSSQPFSQILELAMTKGLTEPDPRDDLSGTDVARKLLILSREIGLPTEIEDIMVSSLIPQDLHHLPLADFLNNLNILDEIFAERKKNQESGHVLRYVGELDGSNLSVKLVSLPEHSPLGKLHDADTVFAIYTQQYHSTPLVIQGTGAGAEVTANGIFSDVLKLGQLIKYKQ